MKSVLIQLVCAACCLQGCAVITVADTAVSVTATAVKAGAAVVGTGVDVACAGVKAVTGSNGQTK